MGNSFRMIPSLLRRRYTNILRSHKKKVVVITGCDSGLGYSLSLKCNEMGLTVVSGCLNLQSDGAKALTRTCQVYSLDLTNSKSVKSFAEKVNNLLNSERSELHAVVNNAGVMIFGEFEWYTEEQILQQVQVNMLGCFRMAKVFLPLLRKDKGRMINVTSHCALTNLPTLTVYGATKGAIQSWTDGLRIEQQKYGVKIINFIPGAVCCIQKALIDHIIISHDDLTAIKYILGSFASQSNIMLKQKAYSKEMEDAFSEDDQEFYGKYFKEFNTYLDYISGDEKPVVPLKDNALYRKFTDALLSERPKPSYRHEPWRYFFYYNSFRFAPLWLKDFLIKKFMKFPQYKPNPS